MVFNFCKTNMDNCVALRTQAYVDIATIIHETTKCVGPNFNTIKTMFLVNPKANQLSK